MVKDMVKGYAKRSPRASLVKLWHKVMPFGITHKSTSPANKGYIPPALLSEGVVPQHHKSGAA